MYTIVTAENWIGQLPQTVREAIEARMTVIDVPAGEEIKRVGEPVLRMHQVVSGYIKLTGLHEDGRQSLITIYAPGNCFSETALVSRRPTHHHTSVALTAVRLRVLSVQDFWEVYYRYPEVPEALCRKFAGAISRQMSAREQRATVRLGKRVAMMFENLAELCAERRIGSRVTIAVPITQSDIADHFDVTRQSIQREITALKSAGVIDKHDGRWIVRDMTKLARA